MYLKLHAGKKERQRERPHEKTLEGVCTRLAAAPLACKGERLLFFGHGLSFVLPTLSREHGARAIILVVPQRGADKVGIRDAEMELCHCNSFCLRDLQESFAMQGKR